MKFFVYVRVRAEFHLNYSLINYSITHYDIHRSAHPLFNHTCDCQCASALTVTSSLFNCSNVHQFWGKSCDPSMRCLS